MFIQALFLAAAFQAPPGEEAVTLHIGDKAPAISAEHWVKGDAVSAFEKGRIYVVEFWATWCAPCIESIPHLTETQAHYKDKNVTVIGVAASEQPDDEKEKLEGVKAFVTEKGDKMGYTVAVDTDRSMATSWMQAAGQSGIPTAFLINGDGLVAWVGHPMEMDASLEGVVSGSFDLKAATEKARKQAEAMKKAAPLQAKIEEAAQAQKWDEVIKAFDEMLAIDEEVFAMVRVSKFQVLLTEMGEEEKAYAYAKESLPKLWDQVEAMGGIAWLISDPETKLKTRDLELALKAADRANELTHEKNAGVLDLVAQVHAAKGDFAKAVEFETKAVAFAQEGEMRTAMDAKLKEYQEKSAKKS
ncbi:MAG: TlpA disulfide reductase family protein [Planctomycetota bacterium]